MENRIKNIARDTVATARPPISRFSFGNLAFYWKNGQAILQTVKMGLTLVGQFEAGSEERRDVVSDLLLLLQQYPWVFSKLYCKDSVIATPLHCFLKAGEGLNSVQALCETCPSLSKMLWTKDEMRNRPIHLACAKSSPAVIQYLLQKTRGTAVLRKPNGAYDLPCHCALTNQKYTVSSTILQKLLKHCYRWDSEREVWSSERDKVWSLALLSSQPAEVLECMVEAVPKKQELYMCLDLNFQRFWLGVEQRRNQRNHWVQQEGPINLIQAKALAMLCQKLQQLTLRNLPGFDCDAFCHFFTVLQDNRSLSHLKSIGVPVPRSPEDQNNAQRAFQLFLERNVHIEELEVSMNESDALVWNSWIQVLKMGLDSNQTLATRKIQITNSFRANSPGHQFRWWMFDWRDRVIACPLEPKEREEFHGGFLGAFRFYLRLESFDLCSINLDAVLQNAPQSLGKLELVQGHKDISEPRSPCPLSLREFLARSSPALRFLEIDGYNLDAQPILDALKGNQSLKEFRLGLDCTWDAGVRKYVKRDCFHEMKSTGMVEACVEMLRDHNLVLEQCEPWDKDPRVQYYLTLNRFGRAKVRKTCGCEELVGILLGVQDKRQWKDMLFHGHECGETCSEFCTEAQKMQLSAAYGLLREMPLLWCSRGGSTTTTIQNDVNHPVSGSTVAATQDEVNCSCWPRSNRS